MNESPQDPAPQLETTAPPVNDLPPLPRPFDTEPRSISPSGCGRGALVGCGVLVVLFGIAGVVFVAKANDMLAWLMEKLEDQIVATLPDDLPPDERQRLDQAFDDLYEAIAGNDFDPIALQSLQPFLLEATQKASQGLSREDVRDLTEAIEKAAGRGPPEVEDPEPAPTPDPTSESA